MDFKQQILAQFPNVLNQLYLPIQSVDGIQCQVSIKKAQTHNLLDDSKEAVFYLKIETKKNTVVFDDQMTEYQYYSEKIDLTQLKQTLDSLKFNRMTSKFTSKPIVDWSFLESDTVKLNCDKCCVCMETTTDKTDCGHSLCVPCYDKIKLDEDCSTLCPLCREECYYE
jgi:hypothetical protein